MNWVPASPQPILQHRQQNVVRHEEAKVDNVVGVDVDVVIFESLERRLQPML